MVLPRRTRLPSRRRAWSTRSPSTTTPLVEPTSTTVTSPPERRSSAWSREMPGSSMRRSESAPRPMRVTGRARAYVVGADLHPGDAGSLPGAGSRCVVGSPRRPRPRRRCAPGSGRSAGSSSRTEVDGDRADERVALLLGVLADHRGELVAQRVAVDVEALVVVLAEGDGEGVGDHRAAAGDDRGPVVALALEGAGDLDRLHLGLEGPGEGAVDHLLDASLEALQDAHVTSCRGRRPVRACGAGPAGATGRPGHVIVAGPVTSPCSPCTAAVRPRFHAIVRRTGDPGDTTRARGRALAPGSRVVGARISGKPGRRCVLAWLALARVAE